MKFLARPRTGVLLDRLLESNARVDAELADRRVELRREDDREQAQRELNEMIFVTAIRAWFRKEEAKR